VICGGKYLADVVFMSKSCALLQRKDLLKYLPLAEVFHISYLLVVAPLSLGRKFKWKGRQYTKNGPVAMP
jgi:hypothetical protein